MTYGKSKERDMVRSILPSTARKGARENKRNVNQRHRSSVRQALRQHRDVLAEERFFDHDEFDVDSYDERFDFDAPYDKICNADHEYKSRIKYVMWDRREADKVAPIIRWAEAKVADVRPEDRLSWLQARMPDNLAVRHAVSHIKFSDAFPDQNPYEYYWRSQYYKTPEERAWESAAKYAQVVVDLQRICEGPLGRFNKFIPKAVYRTTYYGGYNTRVNRTLQAPWRLVVDKQPTDLKYWDGKQVWQLDIERLQGVHHIDEWLAFMAKHKFDTRDVVERAIRMTYESTADSYWTFDERSRHGRKEKV
jgi:hypothetical protein